ncbi:hypothetical protein LCGC14_2530370, partial [marine sediment metagenome]
KLQGDIAEVGVYRGKSAKRLATAFPDKELHLFDTFEGFPNNKGKYDTDISKELFHKGTFFSNFKKLKSLLSEYPNVFFHKGIFSDTCKEVSEKRFALVHLDFDMYEPTKHAIEFFYPRMNPGGVMIFHDYRFFAGIKKVINEFFEDKKEVVFCWNENQGIAFITGVGEK